MRKKQKEPQQKTYNLKKIKNYLQYSKIVSNY